MRTSSAMAPFAKVIQWRSIRSPSRGTRALRNYSRDQSALRVSRMPYPFDCWTHNCRLPQLTVFVKGLGTCDTVHIVVPGGRSSDVRWCDLMCVSTREEIRLPSLLLQRSGARAAHPL